MRVVCIDDLKDFGSVDMGLFREASVWTRSGRDERNHCVLEHLNAALRRGQLWS